jgi:hypothetical protein
VRVERGAAKVHSPTVSKRYCQLDIMVTERVAGNPRLRRKGDHGLRGGGESPRSGRLPTVGTTYHQQVVLGRLTTPRTLTAVCSQR